MKYVCDRCGEVKDEEELTRRSYFIGYSGNCPCFEEVTDCSCGGIYVEAKECTLCGEWFDPDELCSGVCEECLEAHATPDNAVLFGMLMEDKTEGVRSLFSEAETLRILIGEKARIMNCSDEFAKNDMKKRAAKFLLEDCDKDNFAEFLLREDKL